MRYSPKEIEKLIVKLAKAGKSAAEIGTYLRDSYGIPSVRVATEKRIDAILAAHKVKKEFPDDLMFLIKRYLAEKKHLERNKQDQVAKRGLLLTTSKINRLTKYYKRSGRLPADWHFDPERAKLLIG